MIYSFLDTDIYKLYVQQVVFHYRKILNVPVEYKLYNRGKKLDLSKVKATLEECMFGLSLTKHELLYLMGQEVFSKEYLGYLGNYKFDTSQVEVSGDSLRVKGNWLETILWEVPLMAIISELNRDKAVVPEDIYRIAKRWRILEDNNIEWADFGTRRRYSSSYHSQVIASVRGMKNFQGTSNALLASIFKLPLVGTMAHEGPMAMQAIYPQTPSTCTSVWLDLWKEVYGDSLSVALLDTLRTDTVLNNFVSCWVLNRFNGFRQDSGDPIQFVFKIYQKLKQFGINPTRKKIIFSNSLTPESAVEIVNQVRHLGMKYACGIGTSFTNIGEACNFVIKLDKVNGIPVVKLSDDVGKYTGDSGAISRMLEVINVK